MRAMRKHAIRKPGRTIAGAMLMTAGILILSSHPSTHATEQGAGSEKMVKETKEAVEATKQYTIEKKEAFEKTVQAELRDIQGKIAELQAKTASASGEARIELQKAIKDLEIKKDDARKALNELHNSTASAWHRFKDDMNSALERLRQSYRESLSKLP